MGLGCAMSIWAQSPPSEGTTTSSSEKNENEQSSTVRISVRPEILGLWGMDIPNNKQCVEYYNFRGNNEVVINSNKEWSYGRYQYQVPNHPGEFVPALAMQIVYDNNEVDCSGRKEDQSGEIQQFFVKWINPQKIQFCGTERGEQCFATLNRKLP